MSKRPEQRCSTALVLNWNILLFSFSFFLHTNNDSNSLLLFSVFSLFCCCWPRFFTAAFILLLWAVTSFSSRERFWPVRDMSSGSVAASHGRAAASTHGGGPSRVGRGLEPAGQPGSSGHGRGRGRGRGTVTVTVGGGTSALALSTGAPGVSVVVPAHGDAMDLDDDDDENNDD